MESLGDTLRRVAKQLPTGTDELPPDMLASFEAGLRAEEREPVCAVCRDFGWVRRDVAKGDPDFGKAFPCPNCAEQRRAAANRRVRAKLPEAQRANTFSSLDPRRELNAAQAAQYADACRCAQAMASGALPRPWLLLAGPPGGGKTQLAVCLANYRTDHPESGLPPAVFVNVPEMLEGLRGHVGSDDFHATIRGYMECPLLILDDLGAERETPWAVEQLYMIVNHRYFERSPLIVTTNVGLDKLDERIASRLNDTGTGLVQVCRMDLPDFRERKGGSNG